MERQDARRREKVAEGETLEEFAERDPRELDDRRRDCRYYLIDRSGRSRHELYRGSSPAEILQWIFEKAGLE